MKVYAHLALARQSIGEHGQHSVKSETRDANRDRCGDERDESCLGKSLPKQSQPARTQCAPYCGLAVTLLRTRNHQHRDVGAGDEQHETDGTKQEQQ
jgi:hypothetical protein